MLKEYFRVGSRIVELTMSKVNDLHALWQVLLVEHVTVNPDYFLFMLGKNTEYTHKPSFDPPFTEAAVVHKKQRFYGNGESWPYMA
ncbi:hypothetical protein [Legionella moravica]|nr:hypothetical protein [Legionella moravica]